MGHWIRAAVCIHVSSECQNCGTCPLFMPGKCGPGQSLLLPCHTKVDAHSLATPNTRRNAICTKMMYNYIIHQAWDGVSSTLATVLSDFFSLLSYKFPWYPFSRVVCFVFSERFFISFVSLSPRIQRPGQVFSFGLHLWEVCMSGILRRIQPHGYEAGLSIGFFCLMSYRTVATSSLSMACQLMIGRSYVLVSQTGIDCQQDMLRGGGKSYTHIWHVAVIPCPWAEGGWVGRGVRCCIAARLRPWRVCSQDFGLLLAEHTCLTHVGASSFPFSQISARKDSRVISYSPGLGPGR